MPCYERWINWPKPICNFKLLLFFESSSQVVPTMANISLQSGSEAISYHFTICLRNLLSPFCGMCGQMWITHDFCTCITIQCSVFDRCASLCLYLFSWFFCHFFVYFDTGDVFWLFWFRLYSFRYWWLALPPGLGICLADGVAVPAPYFHICRCCMGSISGRLWSLQGFQGCQLVAEGGSPGSPGGCRFEAGHVAEQCVFGFGLHQSRGLPGTIWSCTALMEGDQQFSLWSTSLGTSSCKCDRQFAKIHSDAFRPI